MEIVHDEERSRFAADVAGGLARLEYTRGDDGVVDFRSTYVPDAARGEGVAAKLVTRGLEWAREEGLKVVPSCSYVRSYVDRHPDYAPLVAD